MKVSTVSIDITPHNEVKLCGYINDVRNTQRTSVAHAPIYAIALYMEIQDKKLLFISMDVLSVTKERLRDLKERIQNQYDIDYDSIFVNAIHTHSGPSGFSVDAMGKEYENNEEFRNSVVDRIVSGLNHLFTNTQEARSVIGKVNVKGFYDNRNDANLYFDDEAYTLQFLNDQNQLVASFVNLNVHSTVLGPFNMEISYDLIGTIRENLYKEYGTRPYVCIGTSADISNRHFRQGDDFDELNRVSKGIADILIKNKQYDEIILDRVDVKTFKYHLEYDNKVNYDYYREELNRIQNELDGTDDKTKVKLLTSSKDKYESKLKIDIVSKDIECKVIDFPTLEIITFPGELTSTFGKQLKSKSKKPYTITITCCNDHHGYFIEKEQFGKCYESTATLIPKGQTEQIIEELGNFICED